MGSTNLAGQRQLPGFVVAVDPSKNKIINKNKKEPAR
jgi:hypothetical protein